MNIDLNKKEAHTEKKKGISDLIKEILQYVKSLEMVGQEEGRSKNRMLR